MTDYATGGLVSGTDPTPIFTATLLAQSCGYVLSAADVRALRPTGLLAKLNATDQ